jgi:hypothetical protein
MIKTYIEAGLGFAVIMTGIIFGMNRWATLNIWAAIALTSFVAGFVLSHVYVQRLRVYRKTQQQ